MAPVMQHLISSLRVARNVGKYLAGVLFIYVAGFALYAWFQFDLAKSKLLTYGVSSATASMVATAVLLVAVALPALAIPRIVMRRGRFMDYLAVFTLPLISWGAGQIPANFDARTGQALHYCAERPDRTLYCLDHPGRDPMTQRELVPINQNMAETVYRREHGVIPQPITRPLAEIVFFDPVSGQPKIWVQKNKGDCYDLFDNPGSHQQTGERLIPVSRDIVQVLNQCYAANTPQKYCATRPDGELFCQDGPGIDPITQQRLIPMTENLADVEYRKSRGLVPHRITTAVAKIEFFDSLTGKPRVWFLQNESGCYEMFDHPGVHPQTGEQLKPVTKEVVRAIVGCSAVVDKKPLGSEMPGTGGGSYTLAPTSTAVRQQIGTTNQNSDIPSINGLESKAEANDGASYVRQMISYAAAGDQRRVQEIRGLLERTRKVPRGNRRGARQLNDEGLEMFRVGNYTEALQSFRLGHETDPGDIEIHNNMGYALLMVADLAGAEAVLIEVLMLAPGRAAAWGNLGHVYARQGKLQEAIASFSNVLRFSSNPGKALAFFANAAESDPDANVREAARRVREMSNSISEPSKAPYLLIRRATATPSAVKPGDTVQIDTDYSLMMAPGTTAQGADVQESFTLKKDGKVLTNSAPKTFHRASGGWVATKRLPIPQNAEPGTYIIETKVQVGSSYDTDEIVFIVGS
ncbi:MAG: tetratricopeptide repeat protein [Gammaproteobacteria bacterium]